MNRRCSETIVIRSIGDFDKQEDYQKKKTQEIVCCGVNDMKFLQYLGLYVMYRCEHCGKDWYYMPQIDSWDWDVYL